MKDLDKLIDNICNANYTYKNGTSTIVNKYSSTANEERAAIAKVVYDWASTQLDDSKRIAELEAKCYAYEQIISNSSFAPVLTVQPQMENIPDACKHCSNHPSNGGNGVCNCMLGTETFY